MDKDDTQRNS